MTDINDWPSHPDADPDCECCLGDGLQADGETPCPCIDARKANIAALTIPPALQPEGEPVTLTYTNWRGETAQRTITPKRIWLHAIAIVAKARNKCAPGDTAIDAQRFRKINHPLVPLISAYTMYAATTHATATRTGSSIHYI